jgi:hypothetical protein
MLALGTSAPNFDLPDFNGQRHSLEDFASSRALLVVFICNHCPFVNDLDVYPQDGPDAMREEARSLGYVFPYLVDAGQQAARAYRAACTPDFFLFDADRRLVYRGQFDDSRPGNDRPVTGADLRRAVDAVLAGASVDEDQRPSLGCNIKWKPGNEPDYAGP